MHKPSCQKSRKTIITQKVHVIQSSHVVHCDWYTKKAACADFQAFVNTFSLLKLTFFHFLSGELGKQKKFHILFILTGKNASKWLEWCIFRVWGMLNPMQQVLSLCHKQFLKKQNFRQKFHILLILTGKYALKWLEQCVFRVWGMPNPMALVVSLW